jgi:hypothetical protein
MELRPYWYQAAGVEPPIEWPKNATHLLLHDGQAVRPDGLIVTDEILVNAACAGVLAAGARVGQDLEVVAHCNLPRAGAAPGPDLLPLKWLGFETARILRACLDYIERARTGHSPPALRLISPRFEDEAVADVASVPAAAN